VIPAQKAAEDCRSPAAMNRVELYMI